MKGEGAARPRLGTLESGQGRVCGAPGDGTRSRVGGSGPVARVWSSLLLLSPRLTAQAQALTPRLQHLCGSFLNRAPIRPV